MFFREPATQAQAQSPAARGVQPVEINIERLFAMRAGETIVLNLPGRAGVQLQHDRIESGWDSGKVWIGKTTDGGGLFHTFVSVSGAAVNGTLSLPFGEFWLSGTVGSTSLSALSAAGLQRFVGTQRDSSFPQPSAALPRLPLSRSGPTQGGQATIDLLVVTTPEFEQDHALSGGANARVNLLVAKANQAFRDSGVLITLRIAQRNTHAGANATQNERTLNDITPINGNTQPIANTFKAWRASSRADIVIYLRKFVPQHGNCGQAWVGGYRESAEVPPYDLTNQADHGYAVVSDGRYPVGGGEKFCSDTTLAHEIGHNLGSMHDHETDAGPARGAFDESFGHHGISGSRGFTTIMGYPNSTYTAEVPAFSNPLISTPCFGAPCGVAAGGLAADNSRRFNDVRFMVAAWFGSSYPVVSVGFIGTGEGVVTGPGLGCAQACTAQYEFGKDVQLTATPAAGSAFVGWSGACSGGAACNLVTTNNRAVSAEFRSLDGFAKLTVSKEGRGKGRVTGDRIDCGSQCVARYPAGTQVTLTATAEVGFVFAGWGGVCIGASTCRIALDESKAVSARFVGARVSSFAAGQGFGVAVKVDGTLWAWGDNSSGQYGNGTQLSSNTPVLVGRGFEAVFTGAAHTFATKRDGTLWAWGSNEWGQLGDGTKTHRLQPVQIGSGFLVIASGIAHTLGIKAGGSTWAWGRNYVGQLGNGSQAEQLRPIQIGSDFSLVSAAGGSSYGVKRDGTLWAWGNNEDFQLGDGSNANRLSPVQVGSDFSSVHAGFNRAVAIKRNGNMFGWGSNRNGELGNGEPSQPAFSAWVRPIAMGGGYARGAVDAAFHSAAVKTSGQLFAWGEGFNGNPPGVAKSTPTLLGTNFRLVWGGGENFYLALKQDGSLWAWGDNRFGQLGDGTNTDRWKLVSVFTVD